MPAPYPETPDGRYFVMRGRLWRKSDPSLAEDERQALVSALMTARREIGAVKSDPKKLADARSRVDAAKRGLGERGPVWWSDGAPDYGRKLARDTPYANWFSELQPDPA